MNFSNALEDLVIWEMTVRSITVFIVLLLLTRLMGKKQISQLSYFHYINGITIGSIAGEISVQSDTHFLNGMIALVWWFALTIAMSWVLLRWKKARKILDDEPTVVVRNGQLLERSMRSLKLHMDDFMMLLREQGVFSIKEIEWAIMEGNGQVSVLKKVEELPATKQDVKADLTKPKYLPTDLIVEGMILHDNLRELELGEAWLLDALKRQQITDPSTVFYAQIQTDGTVDVHQAGPKK